MTGPIDWESEQHSRIRNCRTKTPFQGGGGGNLGAPTRGTRRSESSRKVGRAILGSPRTRQKNSKTKYEHHWKRPSPESWEAGLKILKEKRIAPPLKEVFSDSKGEQSDRTKGQSSRKKEESTTKGL